MEKLYFNLVLGHERTCDPNNTTVKQVPAKHRAAVLKMLTDNGYDANGNVVE